VGQQKLHCAPPNWNRRAREWPNRAVQRSLGRIDFPIRFFTEVWQEGLGFLAALSSPVLQPLSEMVLHSLRDLLGTKTNLFAIKLHQHFSASGKLNQVLALIPPTFYCRYSH